MSIFNLILYCAHNLLQVQCCCDKCAPATVISCNKTQVAILSIFADIGGTRDGVQKNW